MFHTQLKRLWESDAFLSGEYDTKGFGWQGEGKAQLSELVARQYPMFGRRWVPLVIEDFNLSCSLRILFLRREPPGSVIKTGDIDNRVKTLFDALRMPQNLSEVFENDQPEPGEDPMFVLLRDDDLITHLEIETDMLWEPPTEAKGGADHVRVVIDVNLRPSRVSYFNVGFSGCRSYGI